MAHDHAHSHTPDRTAERGALKAALILIVAFMLVEVTVGALAHSLALLSDAAHMLTDAVALAIALVAAQLAARPASGAMTYGLGRGLEYYDASAVRQIRRDAVASNYRFSTLVAGVVKSMPFQMTQARN